MNIVVNKHIDTNLKPNNNECILFASKNDVIICIDEDNDLYENRRTGIQSIISRNKLAQWIKNDIVAIINTEYIMKTIRA